MKHFILAIGAISAIFCQQVLADDAADCAAAAGTLVTGKVTSGPKFKSGQFRKGVELSHTHISLIANDGASYDVAMDNVFAAGYQRNAKSIPAPLSDIQVGDRLEVCGQPFPGGIHFVHTNCGDKPVQSDPNGWVRKLAADGTAGDNLEGAQGYCWLWPRK